MATELTDQERTDLANRYRPLLVLYPEIEPGSRRRDHHHKGHKKTGHPPLNRDYHPRGVEIVLDHAFARIPGKPKPTREDILNAMSDNKIEYINLIKGAGPGRVARFWQVYAALSREDRDERYPRQAYVRVLEGYGRYSHHLVIQYWLAYFFDDWANVHEMDWEMVSVVVRRTADGDTPVACSYRCHMGGFRLPWQQVQKVDDGKGSSEQGSHPVVYVASGSHACYFEHRPQYQAARSLLGPRLSRRVMKFLPWLAKTFRDYVPTFAEGDKHFPAIALIPKPDSEGRWPAEWRWLNFRGRWGTKAKFWRHPIQLFTLPIEEDGPTGPPQKGLYWDDPFTSIDFECFDASSWILSV